MFSERSSEPNQPDDCATQLLSAGDQIGDLEILGFIASGGSGEVYRAWDRRLGRDVAFKILTDVAEKHFDRTWAEARAAAGAGHPNVVAVHSVGSTNGRPWFTMPFADVGDLCAALSSRPLGADRTTAALSHLQEVASALDHLHSQHPPMIHSDIKPANILVFGVKLSRPFACLADFGLATVESPESSFHVAGTPGYLAPERFSGVTPSVTSDLYAFACTAFEAVTGTRAFSVSVRRSVSAHSRINAYKNAHAQERRPRPSDVDPSLAHLDGTFIKALAIRPEERFSSASSFLEALNTAIDSGTFTRSRAKRHQVFTAATIAIIGALIFSFIAARRFFIPPESECPSPEIIQAVETTDGTPQLLMLGGASPDPDAHWLPDECRLQVAMAGDSRYEVSNRGSDEMSTLYIFRDVSNPDRRDEFVREVLSQGLPDDGKWVNPATENLGREAFAAQYIIDYARYATEDTTGSACVSTNEHLNTLFVEVHKGLEEEAGPFNRGDGTDRVETACQASKNLAAVWFE